MSSVVSGNNFCRYCPIFRLISTALIALIALLHLYIAWFEIFAWTSRGPAVFTSFQPELFAQTIDMAANQGVYNLFLALGLIWSLLISDTDWKARIATCFLGFVLLAGLTAAITIELSTGLVQMLPAAIALTTLYIDRKSNG